MAWPAPAGADAAQPTDFRSEITDVRPTLPTGVEVRVVGNGAFLEVRVSRGARLVVPDYDPEAAPYLRFGPDGVVERNRRAAATAANDTRYGRTDAEAYDAEAEPVWEVVAHDGTYAWHDHRIHWMSPTPPRAVDDDGLVDLGGPDGTWSVPLVVDGTPTTVVGQLRLSPSPSPVPWLAGALVLTALLVALARLASTGRARWVPPLVAGGTALGALVASAATWLAAPIGSGPSPMPLLLAAIATIGAAVLLVARWRRWAGVELTATAAVAATLLTWGWARWSVLTRAHLPTELSPALDRLATAAALGVAVALVIGLLSTQRDEVPRRLHPA